ncbi:MAG: lpdA [Clostridiales bacterium]|jgi:dihydrolipoamide dehydrogenase|nr:lpdA [Clostridiales bacterium]
MDFDVVIIGGGPGGYEAAIRGSQLGLKVCLVEKDALGGTCLNRGCIPTKALYRNAEIINTLKNIDEFGISIKGYDINVPEIQMRKQNIVNQLVGGIQQLLKANKVEVLAGIGSIKDNNTITVTYEDGKASDISTKNIIIATGSTPLVPPIPGANTPGVYTSDEILDFDELPKSLAIIGGGVIGMEFAAIFNSLGSKVTVIEFLPNILAQVDSDFTKRLGVSLKKKGIDIHTSTGVTKIEKADDGFNVFAEGKKGEIQVLAERVLISTGRKPVTEGLNLEAAGVEFDRKGIKVDKNFKTNAKNIYAIGDVNGKMMLAHVASHQGITVIEEIAGIGNNETTKPVPSCVFIFPEIATVGITEDEAKKLGMEYKVSKFMFGANGKALALGESEGMVKVLSDNENTIIGVHIMGPHASDLIQEGTLAVTKKLNVDDIASTIHAHPTLSEAFLEAVLGLKGEAIHMVPPRK